MSVGSHGEKSSAGRPLPIGMNGPMCEQKIAAMGTLRSVGAAGKVREDRAVNDIFVHHIFVHTCRSPNFGTCRGGRMDQGA